MKHKKTGFLLQLVLVSIVSVFAFAATLIIDQQQPVIDLNVGAMAIGDFTHQLVAQTFTAGVTGQLRQVDLPIACDSGQLIVELQGVTASGEPNGQVLSRKVVRATNLPSVNPPVLRSFVFKNAIHFQAGDRFAVVLENKRGSCGIFQGPAGNPYVPGETFFQDDINSFGWVGSSEFDNRDVPFQTWMLIP